MERRERTVTRVNQFKLSPDTCADGPFKGYERLHWINSAALADREKRFDNLLHHFTPGNLRQAFRQIDGNKAVGIDQVTKTEYGKNLEENLAKLADEIRRGGWRPKPSREKLIPKPQGGHRPLAIGCLEDKIVQLLMAKILEAIYEPSFHRHSYGFRTGRSTHQALSRLYKVISERPDNCVVVEMDIEKFFNSMDHDVLMELIEKRIGDQHALRLIRRMLRNSILHENGEITLTERGSPQGAPVSPVLANIYLDSVLDNWFEENWGGKGQLVRYADDAVFVFTSEQTANEFKVALQERLENFGKLKLNSDKSGTLKFDSKSPQGQLTFVGFCLYWGKNQKKRTQLKVKTAPKKLARSIEAFRDWIKAIRHRKKLDTIWEMAAAKLRGHYQYYGVSFNTPKLNHYYYAATQALFKWLNRRSQKRSFTPERFANRLRFNPLPRPPGIDEVLDITHGLGTELKHKPRSRMRKSRTSGSNRRAGWQQLAFT
jgi:RNA-directed DNA polymerase